MASGFNVVDFMDLPAVERCIVRLVLRETTMSYADLLRYGCDSARQSADGSADI